MKPNHIVVSSIIALVIFIGGYYTGAIAHSPEMSAGERGATTIQTDVIIDYGNDVIKTFSDVEMSEDATVWDILSDLEKKESITLEYEDYGGETGYFLKSIDGVGTEITQPNSWWHYWVNAEYALVGMSTRHVKGGDSIFLKYTKARE